MLLLVAVSFLIGVHGATLFGHGHSICMVHVLCRCGVRRLLAIGVRGKWHGLRTIRR